MTFAELDAWLKSIGSQEGAGLLSRGALMVFASADPAKVKAALSAYFAMFTSPDAALMFDHDAGFQAAATVAGYNIPLDQYVNAPDQRTLGVTSDPAEALRRIESGIAWDGTTVAEGAELVARKALADTRAHLSRFAKVDPRMLRYGTIMGIPADNLLYTFSPFDEWLSNQVRNVQER